MKNILFRLIFVGIAMMTAATAHAETITIAAASDLKFAMEEIVAGFKKGRPGDEVQVVYGSSGKFQTQIRQGAPYDLFFSADIEYPRELGRLGMAGSEVRPYAVGRIVLWSAGMKAEKMSISTLVDPKIKRIAIANPRHAPYGKRAEEALRASGLWDKLQGKLVYGENIAHAAQYVQSGNAQVGILAFSLVISPELAKKGSYHLIPDKLHNPLEQGFIITLPGAKKQLARQFADYVSSKPARNIMTKYGFSLPGEQGEKLK